MAARGPRGEYITYFGVVPRNRLLIHPNDAPNIYSKCLLFGYTFAKCPSNSSMKDGSVLDTMNYFNCGELGHVCSNCTKKAQINSLSTRLSGENIFDSAIDNNLLWNRTDENALRTLFH